MTLSYDHCHHKFDAMAPFMPPSSGFVYHSGPVDEIKLDAYLLEAVMYDNGSSCLFYTNTQTPYLNKFDSMLYKPTLHNKPESISFSFVFNGNPDYKKFFDEAYKHYTNLKLPFKTEFVVYNEDADTFDMSRARNRSMELCSYDHIIALDLDVYLNEHQINYLIHLWTSTKHCGVFNLKKHYTTGNGLWFGTKEKLLYSGYSEQFKKFWNEDTEYYCNFSRVGILPLIAFVDYHVVDHSRGYTRTFNNYNVNLFREIFQGYKKR